MGCGGSKQEVVEGQHEPYPASARPQNAPRKSTTQQSSTDSDAGHQTAPPRPIHNAGPGVVLETAAPAPVAPEPKPLVPNGRVNSANPPATLQYTSPRGNLPLKRVQDTVARAPAPGAPLPGPKKHGMYYPKVYGNQEGPRDNPTPNFSPWEILQPQQREGDSDPPDARNSNTKLYEYPIKPLAQPPPFTSDFAFHAPSAGLKQTRPPHANDRLAYEKRWRNPPNDPGPLRAAVNKDGRIVGAIYHPEGAKGRYERSRLEPLDRQGRGELARHVDRKLAGRTTWPERGPGGEIQPCEETTEEKEEGIRRASEKRNK